MLLCMKQNKFDEEINEPENFYLGPPDYSKFTPATVPNFATQRKVCLYDDNNLLQQSRIYSIQTHGTDENGQKTDDGIFSTNVMRCSTLLSSSPQEKKEMFRQSLTNILSCIYCMFVVTLGVIIYIGEINSGLAPFAEIFSIYLVVVGIFYLAFLYVDMRKFSKLLKVSEEMVAAKYAKSESSSRRSSVGRGSVNWNSLSEPDLVLPHHYCFSKGRHSGSFYLKVGAAGFCLGHLLHSGLLISYQVAFLILEPHNFYQCANGITLALDIMYPAYSFMQLFFIFKYSNVIINKHKILARFGLMHCVGSHLCFWIWTILRETVDSMNHHHHEPPASLHHHMKTGNTSIIDEETDECLGPHTLTSVFGMFTPYLYPFTIEYSILVAGMMFVVWQKIGSYSQCTPVSSNDSLISNVVLHADCHSSNKGLFAGLIVLVGSFLSIVLFFVAMTDSIYIEAGLLVNSVTELTLTILMTVTVIPAYKQITKLDVNSNEISLLDDILLFTCIPSFFVQFILSIIPAWRSRKYICLTTVILQVIQVLIQTPFIIDGLRRCSNAKALRTEKPGRELLMFLIVCNVTMWITETFEIKSHSNTNDPRSAYYGELIWSSITHLTFPLTMFYRFHSSVCMADIWKYAYMKGH
ncbi:unnamed protein product [Nezara viridula]|uniref:Proton channel OtopLc-like n=1 Tax=Nezara viridula TaxID=85310 RepID=A0A9P0H9B4_NEZVI|nr:unnamed protein product [Nezara viridula]